MSTRPVYLNLLHIRMPPMGLVSILHRISGVILAIALPFLLWLLQHSLSGEQGYAESQAMLDLPLGRLAVLVLIASLAHHVFAGLRHLALDLHWGLDVARSRQTAWLVMAATIATAAVTAWRLFK
jgi:succinate dehydrogenase / fumarate reductase cytochrome b subunit